MNRAAAEQIALQASWAASGPSGALVVSHPGDSQSQVLLQSALDRQTLVTISKRIESALTPAICLDYDGTLAPIVNDPSSARLPPGTRTLLRELANRHPTAIVSGRSMEKLHQWINVSGLYFAASHGFEIIGPHGSALNYTFAASLLPSIQEALAKLQPLLKDVEGVTIEDNKFALTVHTRNMSDSERPRLAQLLDRALEDQPLLRRSEGKCVIELRPQVHWHKGRAVEWLLKNMCEQMGLPGSAAERTKLIVPVYLGDDTTDEDAFQELRKYPNGISILVRESAPTQGETAAEFWLRQQEVAEFLKLFLHDGVLLAAASEEEEDAATSEGGSGAVEADPPPRSPPGPRASSRPAVSATTPSTPPTTPTAAATAAAKTGAAGLLAAGRGSAFGSEDE